MNRFSHVLPALTGGRLSRSVAAMSSSGSVVAATSGAASAPSAAPLTAAMTARPIGRFLREEDMQRESSPVADPTPSWPRPMVRPGRAASAVKDGAEGGSNTVLHGSIGSTAAGEVDRTLARELRNATSALDVLRHHETNRAEYDAVNVATALARVVTLNSAVKPWKRSALPRSALNGVINHAIETLRDGTAALLRAAAAAPPGAPSPASRTAPRALVSLAWSLTKLDRAPRVALHELSAALTPRIAELSRVDLVQLTYAYSRASLPAPRLFNAVARVVAPRVADFTPAEIGALLLSFSSLRISAPELFEAAAAQLKAGAVEPRTSGRSAMPQTSVADPHGANASRLEPRATANMATAFARSLRLDAVEAQRVMSHGTAAAAHSATTPAPSHAHAATVALPLLAARAGAIARGCRAPPLPGGPPAFTAEGLAAVAWATVRGVVVDAAAQLAPAHATRLARRAVEAAEALKARAADRCLDGIRIHGTRAETDAAVRLQPSTEPARRTQPRAALSDARAASTLADLRPAVVHPQMLRTFAPAQLATLAGAWADLDGELRQRLGNALEFVAALQARRDAYVRRGASQVELSAAEAALHAACAEADRVATLLPPLKTADVLSALAKAAVALLDAQRLRAVAVASDEADPAIVAARYDGGNVRQVVGAAAAAAGSDRRSRVAAAVSAATESARRAGVADLAEDLRDINALRMEVEGRLDTQSRAAPRAAALSPPSSPRRYDAQGAAAAAAIASRFPLVDMAVLADALARTRTATPGSPGDELLSRIAAHVTHVEAQLDAAASLLVAAADARRAARAGGDSATAAAADAALFEVESAELAWRSVRDLPGPATVALVRAYVLCGTSRDASAVVASVAGAFARDDALAARGLALTVGDEDQLDEVAPLPEGSAAMGVLDVPHSGSVSSVSGAPSPGDISLLPSAGRVLSTEEAFAAARDMVDAARLGSRRSTGDPIATAVTPAFDSEPTFEAWEATTAAPRPPPGPRTAFRLRGDDNGAAGGTMLVRDEGSGETMPASRAGSAAAVAQGRVGARLASGTTGSWAGRLLGRTPLPTLAALLDAALLALPLVETDMAGRLLPGALSIAAPHQSVRERIAQLSVTLAATASNASLSPADTATDAIASARAVVGARAAIAALPTEWHLPGGPAWEPSPGLYARLEHERSVSGRGDDSRCDATDAWDVHALLARVGASPSTPLPRYYASDRWLCGLPMATSSSTTAALLRSTLPTRAQRSAAPTSAASDDDVDDADNDDCSAAGAHSRRARLGEPPLYALIRSLGGVIASRSRASELSSDAAIKTLLLATTRRLPSTNASALGSGNARAEPPLARLIRAVVPAAAAEAAASLKARLRQTEGTKQGTVSLAVSSINSNSASSDDSDVEVGISSTKSSSTDVQASPFESRTRRAAASAAFTDVCVAVGSALSDALNTALHDATAAADSSGRGVRASVSHAAALPVDSALRLSAERNSHLHAAVALLISSADGAPESHVSRPAAIVAAAPLFLMHTMPARTKLESGSAAVEIAPRPAGRAPSAAAAVAGGVHQPNAVEPAFDVSRRTPEARLRALLERAAALVFKWDAAAAAAAAAAATTVRGGVEVMPVLQAARWTSAAVRDIATSRRTQHSR